jgi:hypothetical protein
MNVTQHQQMPPPPQHQPPPHKQTQPQAPPPVTKQQVPLDASAGYFKPGQILLTSVYEHVYSINLTPSFLYQHSNLF